MSEMCQADTGGQSDVASADDGDGWCWSRCHDGWLAIDAKGYRRSDFLHGFAVLAGVYRRPMPLPSDIEMDLFVRKRIRNGVICVVERLGARSAVSELRGRWSPSSTVRRDHRDMTQMRVLIAAALGGGRRGIDVGANRGTVSAMFLEIAPDERHVLIEPVEELADRLRADFPSAEVLQAVCAATEEAVDFSVAVDQMTRSSVHPSMAGSGGRVEVRSVRSLRLDDVAGDEPIGLLKIDVEGGELDVLRGAVSTLSTHRPIVVLEHARSDAVPVEQSRSLFVLLDDLRFRIFDIDGRPIRSPDAFCDIVDRGRVWTFVAVPLR